jgi:hypothetical protein
MQPVISDYPRIPGASLLVRRLTSDPRTHGPRLSSSSAASCPHTARFRSGNPNLRNQDRAVHPFQTRAHYCSTQHARSPSACVANPRISSSLERPFEIGAATVSVATRRSGQFAILLRMELREQSAKGLHTTDKKALMNRRVRMHSKVFQNETTVLFLSPSSSCKCTYAGELYRSPGGRDRPRIKTEVI